MARYNFPTAIHYSNTLQSKLIPKEIFMSDKIYKVLFLCTKNSARSIMAEALLTTMGKGRFRGYSAGTHAVESVNPFALEQIKHTGYPLTNLRSKSWDEFGAADAPQMDFIITVCDDAAGEACPYMPGQPLSAHWGFEDPTLVQGSDAEITAAFNKVFRQLMTRMNIFVSLPLEMLEKNAIHGELRAIGAGVV